MKYKLIDNKKEYYGITLYQIQALIDIPAFGIKAGDLGGYIEKESNLSQDGSAWVSGNAYVSGKARICGDAHIYGNARIYGNAWVYGSAWIYGNAWVHGDARVCGNARIGSKLDLVCLTAPKYDLTLTNAGLSIGCEFHSMTHWLSEYKQIGNKHDFTDKKIKHYFKLIKTIDKIYKAQQELKE